MGRIRETTVTPRGWLMSHARANGFAAAGLLTSPGPDRSVLRLKARQTVYRQGDRAGAVYYLHSGIVQLSVVSGQGKEAIVAMLTAGDFFGEGAVAGQTIYQSSAITMASSTVVRIGRNAMIRLVQEQPPVSAAFMNFLLSRSVRIEADLVDQLFNSTERRLARVLVLLADFGPDNKSEAVIPRLSQEALAAKVGTTRSRINIFMNKFRKLGLIEYDHASPTVTIHPSLLNAIIEE
jgi:CRP/FNR family transcriptional regulator, cyclic AMP receptor protein